MPDVGPARFLHEVHTMKKILSASEKEDRGQRSDDHKGHDHDSKPATPAPSKEAK
jgi:hypothetical protein